MTGRFSVVLAVMVAVAIAWSGCGGSDTEKSKAESPAPSEAATPSKQVSVAMDDYSFSPQDAKAEAGKIKFTATNEGKVEHEFVVLNTSKDPGKLKTEPNGEAAEDAYGELGEIEDVEPGDTASKTIKLKPGKYATICNVPGHYKAGMYGTLTVE